MLIGRRRSPYRKLEDDIGYSFSKVARLEGALTHRSFRFEASDVGIDNQRAEFLGDAVLGMVTAEYLYEKFEDKDEGVLTSLRSQITSGKALAALARDIHLGDHIRLGKGEEQSGGRRRPSNLADALEAVLGAAYLDGGIKAVQKIFRKIFVPSLERLSGDVWAENPKGRLQDWAQRRWRSSPWYHVSGKEGPPHAVIFTVEAVVGNKVLGVGRGRNKREAETRAAIAALKHVGSDQQ